VVNEVNKVLFIINKYSGPGFQNELEGRIIDVCAQQDVECTIEYTKARGHATELARDAAASNIYKKVIAVGGDGTVNEVAGGLLHSSVPMGIIPKGSGNGLARHLGIPMQISQSIQKLFESAVVAIDSFTLNGRLSLNVSGIGFDGHIANLFGKEKKRGLQGYARVTLNEFFHFTEFEAEIITEKETIRKNAFIIAIANSSQYGNNARIAPAASVRDGLLHVCFLKKVPPYRFDFIYSFFSGTIDQSSYCEFMEVRKMSIKVDKPIAFHIDGEPCGVTDKFEINVQPRSLQMLIPTSSLHY
jgi:diacylglycerol kinase (ATP)